MLKITVNTGGLDRLGNTVRRELARVRQEEAETFRDRAKALAPEDTGNLKSLITASPVNADEWEVRSDAPYSAPVNYGFRHYQSGQQIPPNPFFSQALAESEARFPQAIAAAVREAVRKAG